VGTLEGFFVGATVLFEDGFADKDAADMRALFGRK